MVAFDCGFLTQENSDKFPILICRDNSHGQIPLLVDLIKNLESFRIILKDEDEPSLKVFRKEELMSFVKCIIQGILVGHHDRTRAISHIIKSGIAKGKSRTRQTLSDAWESTIREDLFGNLLHRRLHTAIAETKLTEKFITDEEGTDLLLSRMLGEKSPEVEHGGFYVLFVDIEAHGHIGSGPGCPLLTSHGEETKPREDEFRKRVGTVIERILAGEARMEAYEDRIAETERVRERKRARVERGAGDVPMEPGNSRWRFDMRTHLAVTS